MKMKNFYLIHSPEINELKQTEKDFLEKQLTIYHTHSSSVIDKAEAIYALVVTDRLKNLRFEYNAWLYDFVNYQLKTDKTAAENHSLKKVLGLCYHVFGYKSHLKGDSINALDNYKKAIKIREKQNDSEGLFTSSLNSGLISEKNGDLSNALKFYEKCVELSREVEDKYRVAGLYINLSAMFMSRGNYSKALNYQYKALSICEENNHIVGKTILYINIGSSLLRQLEIDDALKYSLDALKLIENNGNKFYKAIAYSCIGLIYQEKGENDIALKYYMKALKLQTTFVFPVFANLGVGTIYESQNQLEVAMDYYNKSLLESEKANSKELLSVTLSKIGILEIKKGNVEKASLQIKRAFELAQKLGYLKPIKEAAAAKVHLAIAIKDYKLAYEMEKLKNEMKEKILNKENTKAVIKHQLKYEYEKQLKQKDIKVEEEKRNN